MKKKIKALKKPLSMAQIKKAHKAGKKLTGIIAISLIELIQNDEERVLDIISERLTGTELLENFSYKVAGMDSKNNILLKVVGDVDYVLNL